VITSAFLDNLKRSRLLSDEQFALVVRLADRVEEEELPTALVGEGILTPLQAHRVLAGETNGLVLGPYRVLEEIGRGGMGRVYKALHTIMGRVVALKVMAPDLVQNAQSREWFLREVRNVTRLSHPNIVVAHDANEVDGVLFLAMEFVAGMTLAERVRSRGPLPVGQACHFMRQAALGLQHAHERGLVHRDIKPHNLLLAAAGQPEGSPGDAAACSPFVLKIADFGLARLHGGESLAATSGGFIGTPDFVAPEQCRDSRSADIRADLYSLGCTFYFALVGRPPFTGDNVMEKLFAHATAEPPPLARQRPEVPDEVAAIVARLMAKAPEERYQTPAELALALAPWCEADWLPVLLNGSPGPGPSCDPVRDRDLTFPSPSPVGAGPVWGGKAPHERGCPRSSMATLVVERLQARQADHTAVPPSSRLAAQETDNTAKVEGPPPPQAPSPAEVLKIVKDRARAQEAGNPALSRAWARWLTVVDGLLRQPSALPCTERAYQGLYRALLAECAAIEGWADPSGGAAVRHLEELVRPWMSLHVLVQTEPVLLQDLVCRVHQAGEALGLREESQDWRCWLVVLGVLVVASTAALYALGLLPIRPARAAGSPAGGPRCFLADGAAGTLLPLACANPTIQISAKDVAGEEVVAP
jgi:serine/threonine-protein kinase